MRPLLVRFACALLLLLPRATPAATRAGTLDSLGLYLDGLDAFGFTGQVSIALGDSLLFERAFGDADGRGRPVGMATGFAAGSITKSVTAAIALRLIAEGRFTLDDSLARLLPGVPADKARITPRELLGHTSGLPEDAEGVFEQSTRDEVVRATLAAPLARPPGSGFLYSNAGFQLLAAIAERASGVAFPRLADSLVLAPAGMSGSGVGSAYARGRTDAATGRNEWLVSGSFRDWRQPWAGSGAGDLVTTAHDLWRWARALQPGGSLAPALADSLSARRVPVHPGLDYGFGAWLIEREGQADLVSLGGDVPGYHAGVWFERESRGGIVALTNAGERWGRRLPVAAAQRALWLVLHGQPVPLPPETVRWPRERLERLAGDWTLSPSGRLSLVRDGAGLRLQLSGPDAMALTQGPDSSGARALAEGRTADIVRAVAAGADSAFAAVLLPVERGWIPELRRLVADHEAAHGPLIDAAIDGTVALPWLNHGLRTYVRLHSQRGDTGISFAWLSGGLLDVAAGEDRPAPEILPVAPLAAGGLGAWDLLDGTLVRIEPFADERGPGLTLSGNGLRFIARRDGPERARR